MTKDNKNSKKGKSIDYDPLEELNEIDDNFTIETEKDYFDEIEQLNFDDIPEYDSTSGKIIKESQTTSKQQSTSDKVVKEKFHLMDEIEEVDINKPKNSNVDSSSQKSLTKEVNPQKPNKKPVKVKKFDLSSKLGLNKENKKPAVRPKKQVHEFKEETTLKEDTKVIDNVKVDSDGVPLLNQFDTEKIKESNLLPKITIRKISFSKIIMIFVGIVISLIGIFQAMNDVVKVSDHVMYGEHESMAMGLIFLGIIIIILAFYKEIMKLIGLNNLSNMMDDIDSPSKPKHKDKKSNKK